MNSLIKNNYDSKSMLGVGIAAGLGLASLYKISRMLTREKWVKVGTVDKLFIYPFKGGKHIEIPMGDFGPMGLKAGVFSDRVFMIINEQNRYCNVKAFPKLALVEANYQEGRFEFSSPESEEKLIIDNDDLIFEESRIVPAKVLEYDINLLWLNPKYDSWFQNLLKTGSQSMIKIKFQLYTYCLILQMKM